MFKVIKLTVDAVKVVLNGIQLNYIDDEVKEDLENGYLRKQRNSGFYGGADGYVPTSKGFLKILEDLL